MKAEPSRARTKRKRTQLPLREGEESYRLLVDLSPDAIAIYRDGKFIYVNQAAERLLGGSAAQLIGTRVLDRVHPDYRHQVRDQVQATQNGRQQAPLLEEKFLRCDGREIDIEVVGMPAVHEGKPAVQIVIRDISERKRAEKLQEAVYRIAEASNQSQTLDDLYQALHSIISSVMPANNFYISLYDEKRDLLTFPYFVDEVDSPPQPKHPQRGLTEYVLRTGKSLLCSAETEEELRRLGEIELIGAPSPIWLGVPLIVDKKTIGVMTVQHYSDATAYGVPERQVLEFVSSQVARGIERKRAEQELASRADEFGALFETARDLALQTDLPTLLSTIVERATTLLHTPCGFIYLYDEARGDLELTVEKGMFVAPGVRLATGEGMAGRVAQSLEPLTIDDYRTWEHRSAVYSGVPYAAVVEVPMLYGGRLVGVLGVSEIDPSTRRFSEADGRLLSLFAGQAASAVHNARLLQQTRSRAEQLALLYDAGLALNSVLEPGTQLEFLFNIAMKALHADRAEFFRYYQDDNQVRFEIGVGFASGTPVEDVFKGLELSAEDGRGLVGWVATHRLPLYLPDVLADERYVVIDPEIQSALWVPVEHENRLLGVLGVFSTFKDSFSKQDERLLMLFANQAAVALENARLYTAAQQELIQRKRVEANLRDKIATLQTLAEIDREVIAAAEAPAVMQLVCRRAAELLHAPKAAVRLQNARQGAQVVASHGLLDPESAKNELSGFWQAGHLSGNIGKIQGTFGVADLSADNLQIPEFTAREGLRSMAVSPLSAVDHFLGLLMVFDTEPRTWTAEDLELLSLLAGQAAIALEKTRILAELESSLAMTTRFYQWSGQILAANTFEETARLVTHTLSEGFAADAASIHLYDPLGHSLFQYGVGFGDSGVLEGQPRPEGLTGRVLRSDAPFTFDDPSGLHPLVRAAGIRSGIAIPLRGDSENFGVLFADYRQPHSFTEREVELFSLFANQTALALKRVRLLDETRRRADQLAVLNHIASATNRTLQLDELMQTIHREVSAAVAAESFLIALYDPVSNELDYRIHIDGDLRLPPERMTLAGSPLMTHIIRNRETLLIKDLRQEGGNFPTPRLSGTMRPPRSWLGVPMQVGSSIVGVICVQAYHPNAYGAEEKQFLATVADQVAVAVRNARLFEETHKRLAELEGINKISTAVRVAQTPEEMLPLLLDESLGVLGTSAGQIAFYDPLADELRVVVSRGWFTQTPTASPADDGIAGRVFTTGRPYITREFRPDPTTSELARLQIPEGWGGAVVPIRAGSEIIGVFNLAVPLPREIQPSEVHLLTTIAEIAGNAFHRMRLHESLEESYLGTVLALANALDARDAYTNGHSEQLAKLAIAIAQQLGMAAEDLEALRYAARLHDIGKIGVPDSILRKPAALSEDEWNVMRRHPVTGAEIIQPVRRLRPAAPLVRHHHERFDGTGYPDGLRGEAIPLGARVLAVVDAFSAMTDDRVYRKARPRVEVLSELQRCAGTQFDPKLVEIFLCLEPQFSSAQAADH